MAKDDLKPSEPKAECVRVVVRCRPLNGQELSDGRAMKVGSVP